MHPKLNQSLYALFNREENEVVCLHQHGYLKWVKLSVLWKSPDQGGTHIIFSNAPGALDELRKKWNPEFRDGCRPVKCGENVKKAILAQLGVQAIEHEPSVLDLVSPGSEEEDSDDRLSALEEEHTKALHTINQLCGRVDKLNNELERYKERVVRIDSENLLNETLVGQIEALNNVVKGNSALLGQLEQRVEEHSRFHLDHADQFRRMDAIADDLGRNCDTTHGLNVKLSRLVDKQKQRWDKVRKRLWALEEAAPKVPIVYVTEAKEEKPPLKKYYLVDDTSSPITFLCQGEISGSLFTQFVQSLDGLRETPSAVCSDSYEGLATKHMHLIAGFPQANVDRFSIRSLEELKKRGLWHP